MKCYICKGEAELLGSQGGDFEHVKCGDCGEYKVSGSALSNSKIHRLDLEKIRQKLKREREKTGEVPMISTMDL